MAQYIYLAMAVAGAIWLIGYIIHLSFGRFVLKETRDPASLKHAAEFTRSYRSANFKSIADVIVKLAGRGPRSLKLRQAVQHCGSALGSHATNKWRSRISELSECLGRERWFSFDLAPLGGCHG